jgi:hypothetical protein
MIQEALAAETCAAVVTVEFLAVINLVSAFAAFYGSID